MELPKRKPARLKEYDFSTLGAYFITICVKSRKLSSFIDGYYIKELPNEIEEFLVSKEKVLSKQTNYLVC